MNLKNLNATCTSRPIALGEKKEERPIQPFVMGDRVKKCSAETNLSLKISKHAKQRLTDRGIHFSHEQWTSINEKLAEARLKGVTDSLVLLKEAALIASVKNNTVITVMNREEASTTIFTNINGTIVMENL